MSESQADNSVSEVFSVNDRTAIHLDHYLTVQGEWKTTLTIVYKSANMPDQHITRDYARKLSQALLDAVALAEEIDDPS